MANAPGIIHKALHAEPDGQFAELLPMCASGASY